MWQLHGMSTPPRILFIAPTRIGDAVLATAVLAHILKSEPDARVTIVTSPLSAPLFEGYPQLERILRITKRTYNRHWLNVWQQIVGTHWHEVWDMRNSVVSYLVRAHMRHCYRKPALTAPKVNQYEQVFGIAALPAPTLWPLPHHVAEAEHLISASTPYLIFAPMANWPPKEWPLDSYIALAKALLDDPCVGYRPVIICAANEQARAQPMVDALAKYHPLALTDGSTHLLTLYALMQSAHGFFGNDSGLMHMASAANTPTIGFFGPTPNIGKDMPHVRFLYAPDGALERLKPATALHAFTELMAQ